MAVPVDFITATVHFYSYLVSALQLLTWCLELLGVGYIDVSSGINQGRSYDGLIFIWRKIPLIKIEVKNKSERMLGIAQILNIFPYLILNI